MIRRENTQINTSRSIKRSLLNDRRHRDTNFSMFVTLPKRGGGGAATTASNAWILWFSRKLTSRCKPIIIPWELLWTRRNGDQAELHQAAITADIFLAARSTYLVPISQHMRSLRRQHLEGCQTPPGRHWFTQRGSLVYLNTECNFEFIVGIPFHQCKSEALLMV